MTKERNKMNGRFWAVAVTAILTAVQAVGGGIDRKLLTDFLSVPSETTNIPELDRGIGVLKAWLEARGVFCTIERNEAGTPALYAATTPGKVHDYLFVGHVDVIAAPKSLDDYADFFTKYLATRAAIK